jgi:hypothetical protein
MRAPKLRLTGPTKTRRETNARASDPCPRRLPACEDRDRPGSSVMRIEPAGVGFDPSRGPIKPPAVMCGPATPGRRAGE